MATSLSHPWLGGLALRVAPPPSLAAGLSAVRACSSDPGAPPLGTAPGGLDWAARHSSRIALVGPPRAYSGGGDDQADLARGRHPPPPPTADLLLSATRTHEPLS